MNVIENIASLFDNASENFENPMTTKNDNG